MKQRRNNNIWGATSHGWLLIVLIIVCGKNAETLECYSCDSAEDPECATNPGQQIAVEECASETDECVQVVVAGITRRGCLTRLFPSRYCPEPCERCTRSLCNRDIFPRDRLRCYQCTGYDCINVDDKPQWLLPCPFYHESDRCFMKVLHISNVQRGCEHSVTDSSSCPNTCIKCTRSGCNNESGIWQHSCLECSHTTLSPNPSCWRGQDETALTCYAATPLYCQNKNFYGEESKCFTYINEQTGVVNRGCSSTMPFYPTGNLTQCYGENCNNNCLTISCNICSSADDANCIQGKNLRATKCTEGTQSCFSCESGKHVRRGCADEAFYSTLRSSEACYLCRDSSTTGCNRFPVRTCYACSSMDDEDCDLMNYPDTANQRNCSSHDDLCVSTVVSKLQLAYVLRDCASHLAECTDRDPLCVRCNGSLCNGVPIDLTTVDLGHWKGSKISMDLDYENPMEMEVRGGVNKVHLNFLIVIVCSLFLFY